MISKKTWEAFKKQYQDEVAEIRKDIESVKMRTNEIIKLTTDVLKGVK